MSVVTRSVSSLEPGTAVSRFLRTLALHQCDVTVNTADVARRWVDTPQLERVFSGMVTKAPVVGGTTLDATWAGPLANTGVGAEALTIVRGLSILGAAEPRMRRLPFRVPSPRQTGTGAGGDWVAEGFGVATVAYAFDTVTPFPFKLQSLTVLSDSLARDPFADRTVRTVVLGGHAALTDTKFLDPAEAAAADSPGSITNGATAVTATGTTAAQLTADLGAMIAGVTTSGTELTWILRPTTLARIALALPGSVAGGRLLGIPVIASGNSPQQITLVDLAEIAYADSDLIDLNVSRQATLQMESAPTNSAAPPVPTSLISLYQTDSLAYQATRWLWWARLRTGSVSYMVVTY